MIIGIDGNEANVLHKVGIGEYAFELLTQFKKHASKELQFEIYLKAPPREDLPPPSEHWHYRIVGPKKLWTQVGLPLNLFTNLVKPDVFFTPSHYAPRFSPVPTVISIMDVSYTRFPELFNKSDLYQLNNWTAYSARNAKKILTISQSSKSDIISEYKVPSQKVVVTYPGLKQHFVGNTRKISMEQLEKQFNIKTPYILFVGTLQPRKNIVRLIEALSRLDNKEVTLVIVGKKGWLYQDILDAPKKYNIVNRVTFLDFISDEELPSLYTNAECFVLPSLYEGFGLPVLEAMKYGTPVITSNVSSLPEAGGDAALYVDPENVDDIAEKITEVINSKKVQEQMKEKGFEQIKKFSWEKTAEETLKVLQQVGSK